MEGRGSLERGMKGMGLWRHGGVVGIRAVEGTFE